MENPKLIPAKEDVNLQGLTQEILKQLQIEIQSKELEVTVRGMDAPVIRADRTFMKRALESALRS